MDYFFVLLFEDQEIVSKVLIVLSPPSPFETLFHDRFAFSNLLSISLFLSSSVLRVTFPPFPFVNLVSRVSPLSFLLPSQLLGTLYEKQIRSTLFKPSRPGAGGTGFIPKF